MKKDDEDMPSDASFRAIVANVKDNLPLTTDEQDLRLAIAKEVWRMALKWTREKGEQAR